MQGIEKESIGPSALKVRGLKRKWHVDGELTLSVWKEGKVAEGASHNCPSVSSSDNVYINV